MFRDIYEYQKKSSNNKNAFIIEDKFDIGQWNLDTFKDKYIELEQLEKEFIIDRSKIIEKLLDRSKKHLDSLKELLTLFRRELKYAKNSKLLEKYRTTIHNCGMKLYKKGELIDKQIIDFLPYDEYFTTSIDSKKKEKDMIILNGINISSKDDPLIKGIENKKIYEYLKEFVVIYLNLFLQKINSIKHLSAFFKILPDNYHNIKSSILLKDWIKKI